MTEPCGAIKKDGTPCKQLATYENGRCKWHGGLATGPKTEAGKAQARINGCKGGRPRKDAAGKTQIIDPRKTHVPAGFSGEVLASVPTSDVKVSPRGRGIQEAVPKAPPVLKDVRFSPSCERCTNFAGSGKCLAVAKRIIPSMPTAGACPGFLDFDQV